MKIRKTKKAVLASIVILVVLYFLTPFVLIPITFKDSTPSAMTKVWGIAFSPMINSLDNDNWYKIKFNEMIKNLCKDNPNRCEMESSQILHTSK